MSISVLILTFNEEQNIAACLKSVAWSDDVLVVDSFSTDRTVELARRMGARVLQNRFVNFAEQRNFGLSHGGLKHEWVLHLDADELVPDELRDEMLAVVRHSEKEAYRVALRSMFQGRWIKHASLYPWHQVRLGRRQGLTFVQVGHGQRENLPADKIGTLENDLLHNSFGKGFQAWWEKHNRYSTDEARHYVEQGIVEPIDWPAILSLSDPTRRHRALKQIFFRLPFRPTLRFLYMYLLKLGFLDGRPGLTYCRLIGMHEYIIVLKTRECRDQHLNPPA
jgi:glycosyltransferase involved in cell wall biosynthesis